jgi:hypothetical protein
MGLLARGEHCFANSKVSDMKTNLAEIIFWNNKAYVPSKIIYQSGICSSTEPVYVVDPSLPDLTPVVKTILTSNTPVLADPNREEIVRQRKFFPTKVGAVSWKQLYKEAISYMIELSDQGFLLMIPDFDSKTGWTYRNEASVSYPLNTDFQIILQEILDDYDKRKPPK